MSNGLYTMMLVIRRARPNDAPPSVERTNPSPATWFWFWVKVRNVTYTSPSASMAMSQPCTDLMSSVREIAIGCENVAPESVERAKYTLFWPPPVNRLQHT